MDEGAGIGLFEAIYTNRALRRFKPDPVPDEAIFQIIDAGIRAPTGSNAQSWKFLVVRDPEKRRTIAGWYREAWTRYARQYEENPESVKALPRQQQLVVRSAGYLAEHLEEVPVFILVCGPKGPVPGASGASIYPCVQNMLLAARALGLGSVLTTFHRLHEEDVCRLLNIPDRYETYALLPVGYPEDRHGPVRRRPVREVTFEETWGRAWPFAEAQPDGGWLDRWVR